MERVSNGKNKTPLLAKVIVGIVVALTALLIVTMILVKVSRENREYPSQYTYKCEAMPGVNERTDEEVAKFWLTQFLSEYSGDTMPKEAGIRDVKISDPIVVDESSETVELKFTAKLRDSSTRFFDDWGGSVSGGKISCTWNASFGVKEEGNNKYIYVTSLNVISTDSNDEEENSEEQSFGGYSIDGVTLSATFDGGRTYSQVPVDIKNLPLTGDNYDELSEGSYDIYNGVAAFIYGGETLNGENIPLSIIYSNDGGVNWTTGEIDTIYNVSDYYIKMFTSNNGIIVVGYDKTSSEEKTKIYATNDSGRTWKVSGSGPLDKNLLGVEFINSNTGFFCYGDSQGGNLYYTKDGAVTFSQAVFPSQDLDDTASDKKWSDIFKIATLPELNDDGTLIVYLEQPEDSTYHGGNTKAKYMSTDNGIHWTFIAEE